MVLFPEPKELLDPMAFKSTTAAASPAPVFELKAATFTLPVIRLLGVDMDVARRPPKSRASTHPSWERPS